MSFRRRGLPGLRRTSSARRTNLRTSVSEESSRHAQGRCGTYADRGRRGCSGRGEVRAVQRRQRALPASGQRVRARRRAKPLPLTWVPCQFRRATREIRHAAEDDLEVRRRGSQPSKSQGETVGCSDKIAFTRQLARGRMCLRVFGSFEIGVGANLGAHPQTQDSANWRRADRAARACPPFAPPPGCSGPVLRSSRSSARLAWSRRSS